MLFIIDISWTNEHVDYELYKIFFRVASAGSFTRGAEELSITQSAVSQAIKNLESRLGTALFLRDGRRVRLSREGEVLLYHISQGVRSFSAGERSLTRWPVSTTARSASASAILSAATIWCRSSGILPKAYPGIRIQVKNRTSTGILALLQQGSIDFGIITLPAATAPFRMQPFRSVRDVFVASSRFAELEGRVSPLSRRLPAILCCLLNSESATRRGFDQFLAANGGVEVVPAIELESVDSPRGVRQDRLRNSPCRGAQLPPGGCRGRAFRGEVGSPAARARAGNRYDRGCSPIPGRHPDAGFPVSAEAPAERNT